MKKGKIYGVVSMAAALVMAASSPLSAQSSSSLSVESSSSSMPTISQVEKSVKLGGASSSTASSSVFRISDKMAESAKKAPGSAAMEKKISEVKKKYHYRLLNEKSKEVLQRLYDILESLKSEDLDKAKAEAAVALSLIDEIKKIVPGADVLPISMEGAVYDFPGSAKDVKESLSLVKDLVDNRDLESARAILNALRSEMDIDVTYLDLKSVEDGLVLLQYYLGKGDVESATRGVSDIIAGIKKEHVVVPIPPLVAEEYLKRAEKVKDASLRKSLIKRAYAQLEKGKELGYFNSKEGRALYLKLKNEILAAAKKYGMGEDELESSLPRKVSKAIGNLIDSLKRTLR